MTNELTASEWVMGAAGPRLLIFELEVELHDRSRAVVLAFHSTVKDRTHQRIDCALIWKGLTPSATPEIVYDVGDTWCGVPQNKVSYVEEDSDYTRALVLKTFSMKPGDTDKEYFENHSPRQIEWSTKYSDDLTLEAIDKYGDE